MSLKLAKKDCRSNVYYSTRVLDQLTMQLNLFMGQSGLSLCVPTEELLHTKDDLLVRGGRDKVCILVTNISRKHSFNGE